MRNGPFLFLDIDGVLNSMRYWDEKKARGEPGPLGIDPTATAHLQRIVDETGCQIVLSSTWRLGPPGTLSNVRGQLIAAGMRHPCPLISRTPDLSQPHKPGSDLWMAVKRGDEVKHWLDECRYTGPYVILDDDSDFHEGQPLVRTTFKEGLTAAHADRAIAILKGSVLTQPAEPT